MTPEHLLERGLQELALDLQPTSRKQLLAFTHLLAKWNRTYNLTAVRDPVKMVSHHLLDSLSVLPHLPAGRLADIGSGGGLPGIPIAIAEPTRQVVLNEASEKKVAFLRQATIELQLKNAQVYFGRAEEWTPADRFAVVISRGFSELATFIARCRHLTVPGGVLAAMKGLFPSSELEKAPADVDCSRIVRLHVPFLDAERHLILCRCPV
jgi:16S rRNA (guanine527-N7)-methyltransferase